MAMFDYGTVAELFSATTDSELLPPKHRKARRTPVGFGRFARAADAIRFAMEELPATIRLEACLRADGQIFDHDGIRRLYESGEYPLIRCQSRRLQSPSRRLAYP